MRVVACSKPNIAAHSARPVPAQRMRQQEKRFPKSKRETRAAFIDRLRRTAKGLPSSFINKATGNMKERCERLIQAKGHHFEEGGKSLFVR